MAGSTLSVSDKRVGELQDALLVALAAPKRIDRIRRELNGLENVLDQACEAIYNATLYDPMGERADKEASDDA